MKTLGTCAFAAWAAVEASASAAAVTPLTKVTQMLADMLTKGKAGIQAEQVQYAAFKQFCDDTSVQKQRSIDQFTSQISILNADILKAETEADGLGRDLQQLDANEATFDGDIKAAKAARDIERTDYMAVHQDYSESIDAIGKAIEIVKAKARNTPQASSLMQSLQTLMTSDPKPQVTLPVIAAFLAKGDDSLAQQPEAYAYEFRSGSIVDMLEKLSDKFVQERTQLEKEETDKRHAYDMFVQDVTSQINMAQSIRSSKVVEKAKLLQSAAAMKGALQEATTSFADDSKFLGDLKVRCQQKSSDFNDRQKLRTDEIQAIEQAIAILQGNDVSGAAAKYMPTVMLQSHGSALLQVGRADERPSRLRAVALLSAQAEKLQSKVLAAIALRVKQDPFEQVKKMIQDLISKLIQQGNDEVQHQAWCDQELKGNEQVRTRRQLDAEHLASEIDQKESYLATLGLEIAQLSQDLNSTIAQIAESTALRNKEQATNQQTVLDAKAAQNALGQAITLLKTFYERAGQATSFAQKTNRVATLRQVPAIFEDTYQGMGASSVGVIGMLEVIQSDYARLESTTSANEATAVSDYNKVQSDAAVSKAELQKDIDYKKHEQTMTSSELVDLNSDLAATQKELDTALAYYEKLKPSCLDAGVSFQERDQRRQEEIQSLQEALRILNGEDLSVL